MFMNSKKQLRKLERKPSVNTIKFFWGNCSLISTLFNGISTKQALELLPEKSNKIQVHHLLTSIHFSKVYYIWKNYNEAHFFPSALEGRHAFLSTAGKCAPWWPTPVFLVCPGLPTEASSMHSCWGRDNFTNNKGLKLFTPWNLKSWLCWNGQNHHSYAAYNTILCHS